MSLKIKPWLDITPLTGLLQLGSNSLRSGNIPSGDNSRLYQLRGLLDGVQLVCGRGSLLFDSAGDLVLALEHGQAFLKFGPKAVVKLKQVDGVACQHVGSLIPVEETVELGLGAEH